MAQLHPEPYPGNWKRGDDSRENVEQLDAQLAAIPNVIGLSVAGGKALYHVQSERPLVLQHIPTGVAYQISDAHMRGLTLYDIHEMLRAQNVPVAMVEDRRFR